MMGFFDKYDWQTKNRLLWVGAALLLIVCYQLAIKPTLRLRSEYVALQAGEAMRQANARELAKLRANAQKQAQPPAGRDGETAHVAVVSEAEQLARMATHRRVNVRSLPAPQRLDAQTWQLQYTEYELEGVFAELLQLLRDVEQQPGMNVLSASFVKQPNASTRTPELVLQLRTVKLSHELMPTSTVNK